MIKKIIRLFLILILPLIFCSSAFAQDIFVLKSSSCDSFFQTSDKFDNFTTKLTNSGVTFDVVQEENIKELLKTNSKLLIIPYPLGIKPETVTFINSFVNGGGKIILITPPKHHKIDSFKNLANIIGVKTEEIDTAKTAKTANWVEEKVDDNIFEPNKATIAKITLDDKTAPLAVWDEIERNEAAVTKNDKGVLINWVWSEEGSEAFNNRSMKLIIKSLLPNNEIINDFFYSQNDFDKDIASLENKQDFCNSFINNLKNYSTDISASQEMIEASKINENLAKDAYVKKDYSLTKKHLELANKNLKEALQNVKGYGNVEHRGLWLDRGTLVTIENQNQMAQMFESLKQTGINTVYFETINAGYAIYPSRYIAQNPLTYGRDPLKWAVIEAHKRNIKIHSWMWIFAVGNDRHNVIINKRKDFAGPILKKHPDWMLLGMKGNARPFSQNEFWIDPSNPAATNFLISIGKEISEYGVDGIQLDYIRYPFQNPDNLMGFNPNSVQKYELATGNKLLSNDAKTIAVWNSWKENNINNFTKTFSSEIKQDNPNIKISAAVFSKSQSERKNSIQQNWELWTQEGWVDILNPMIYSMNVDSLKQNLVPFNNVNKKCFVYPGLALKHIDEIELIRQMDYVQTQGMFGTTFFALAQMDEDKTNFLKYGPYKDKISMDPSNNPLKSAVILTNEYGNIIFQYGKSAKDKDAETTEIINNILKEVNLLSTELPCKNIAKLNARLNLISKYNEILINQCFKYDYSRADNLRGYIKRLQNLIYLI